MFVRGCRISVRVIRIIIVVVSVGYRGYVISSAHTRNPSWSSIGALAPGFRFSLLFMNDPSRSPMCVPIESSSAFIVLWYRFGSSCSRYSRGPVSIPHIIPDIRPLIVLWSPNILFPSMNFFPRSIGFPPPNIVGVALATYAGSM